MNFGDVIFQLLTLILMFGLFSAVFFLVRSFMSKQQQQPNKNNNIEQKLDRIAELLEQDKK